MAWRGVCAGLRAQRILTRSFTYQALPMRVRFDRVSLAQPPEEVAALGLLWVLALCSPERADTGKLVAADALCERAAGVLPEARMHVPVEVAVLL